MEENQEHMPLKNKLTSKRRCRVAKTKVTKNEIVCQYWISGTCKFGDKCKYMHSWSVGDAISLKTRLEGHQKLITGIAIPSGTHYLYSGSTDGSIRVWNCHTGKCAHIFNLGTEVGCLISEGPWVFIGIPGYVKAWNLKTSTELTLSGPVGQVYSIASTDNLLLAGAQDGCILVWKFDPSGISFEPVAALTGHKRAVISLVVSGSHFLYSGSMDHKIRVWDLGTFQCKQCLAEHKSSVTSVICWDHYLLSCSMDHTIKVWATAESENLEVIYTHKEEHALLHLIGMNDAHANPVLLCSSKDNSIWLYDLPSFNNRGRLISKEEVKVMQLGPGGLIFSGDSSGDLRVWKWSTNTTEIPST